MEGIGRKGPASRMLRDAGKLKESSVAMEGISELKELAKKARVYGIERMLEVDFSLVRGLDYYTGPIFEISIESGRDLGSVAGGGRYDNLVELYGGKWTPAVGISLGIERIYEIMEEEGMLREQPGTRTEMFIVSVDDSVRDAALRLAQELRSSFVNVETDLMRRDMKKQLKHVNSSGIPYAVIVGPAEVKKGRFTVKDMKSGKEVGMTAKQLVKKWGKC
jgi:histidyl-tRNA synthetase